MAITKKERDELAAEAARQSELSKETDEQKWMRRAMREEAKSVFTELLGDGEDDGKPRSSGGTVSFLDNLFGQKNTG